MVGLNAGVADNSGRGSGQSDAEGGRDLARDFVLDGEDVLHLVLIDLAPEVIAVLGVDELSGDAEAVGGASDAAFEDMSNVELGADLADVGELALVLEGA